MHYSEEQLILALGLPTSNTSAEDEPLSKQSSWESELERAFMHNSPRFTSQDYKEGFFDFGDAPEFSYAQQDVEPTEVK